MWNTLSRWMLVGCLLFSVSARAIDSPDFPRLAGVNYSGPFDYNSSSYQQQLAKVNLSILTMYPGIKPGGLSMNEVINRIKAINPDTLVFFYVNSTELGSRSVLGDAWDDMRAKLDSMKWWLYPSQTSGTPLTSTFGTQYQAINNSLNTRRDSDGNNSVEWLTRYFVRTFANPNPSADGFFMDNVFWKPRTSGDWNIDGTTDSKDSSQTAAWLRAGFRRHVDLAKSLMPGKYQLANIADWGAPDAVYPELSGQFNGGLMEGTVGKSWSVETWGGWTKMMAWYRKSMAAVAAPKLVIFNQVGSPTDYQAMRYGLASCLMDDGYYNFTDPSKGYHGVVWFDEFDAGLGQATGGPSLTAWQNGVYRRDFEKGIALVNPKGNGTVTVTLEADFRRLSGSQAPGVNNGQVTRSVTLKDRDGILLLRNGAVATTNSRPVAPQSVTVQ